MVTDSYLNETIQTFCAFTMHLCVEFLGVNCHTCRCEFTYSAESEPEGFLTINERAVQTFFFNKEWDF